MKSFDEIRSFTRLKRTDSNQQAFWEPYLQGLNDLCHGHRAMGWKISPDGVKKVHGLEEPIPAEHDLIVRNLAKVQEKGYAIEPCGQGQQMMILRVDEHLFLSMTLLQGGELSTGEALVRALLCLDIPVSPPTELALESSLEQGLLQVIFSVLSKTDFQEATLDLVHQVNSQFEGLRVGLGWNIRQDLKLQAVSGVEFFKPDSEECVAMVQVMKETEKAESDQVWPQDDEHASEHGRYARRHDLGGLCTLLLRNELGESFGVLLVEFKEEPSEKTLAALGLLAKHLSVVLMELHERSMPPLNRGLRSFRHSLSHYLGPRHTWRRFFLCLFTILFISLMAIKTTYRVELTGKLVTPHTANMVSPHDATVVEVHAHLGDRVSKGQTMITLDTEELILEQAEARSEMLRYQREAEKARAANQLAEHGIAQAQSRAAQSRLDIATLRLAQSVITSPIDGILVEGQSEELKGTAVRRGERLFKVARNEGLYLRLIVNERDVNHLAREQEGDLRLLSRPDLSFPLRIREILPIAQVDNNLGNTFEVLADLTTPPTPWFRPGMSGVAKIHTVEKSLMWHLTHRLEDSLRMWLWW